MTWKKRIVKELILTLGAITWGIAFAFQKKAMDNIGPFTLIVCRCLVTAIFLTILYFITRKDKGFENTKDFILGSILCGVFLTAGMISQQIGIKLSSTGKSGFITALYLIFVPIIGIFQHKKLNLNIKIAILIALVGLYFINITDGDFKFDLGAILLLLSAIFYALQIVFIGIYSKKISPVLLTDTQFIVCTVLTIPFMFIFDTLSFEAIGNSIWDILYLGVISGGVGYTIQTYAEKDLNPSTASLIMSLESVFSLFAGLIILNETYTTMQFIGCAVLFAAIVLTCMPPILKKERENETT